MKVIKIDIDGQIYTLLIDETHQHCVITHKNKPYNISTTGQNPSVRVLVNAEEFEVKIKRKDAYIYVAEVDGKKRTVTLETEGGRAALKKKQAHPSRRSEKHEVTAPLPGKIVQVMVQTGDSVHIKQVVLSLEAMKMQNEISSPANGVVKEVKVSKGSMVATGDVLVVIEEKHDGAQ